LFRVESGHRSIQRRAVAVPPVTGKSVVALALDAGEGNPVW
jgi:hypothetical protein